MSLREQIDEFETWKLGYIEAEERDFPKLKEKLLKCRVPDINKLYLTERDRKFLKDCGIEPE